jgi:hypothetical protein
MKVRRPILAVVGAVSALVATPAAPELASRSAGTVAIAPQTGYADEDPLDQVSADAALTALGMRGFTLLNDPAHAAYIAEVITTRTEVGTAVAKASTERPYMTGGGVNVPISGRKSVLTPLQRTMIEIRLRERGSERIIWHGAAMTVRSEGARDGGPEQVAYALSQAVLSSYPAQTSAAISVP